MEETKDDGENDVTARELVEAWCIMAYKSVPANEASLDISLTTSKWEEDPRYEGFFHTQRSLVEKPSEALSFLNGYRQELGLSEVDLDHPSLVLPELSDEYRDMIIRSRPIARSQIQAQVGRGTRRGLKAGGRRNPQISRRGPSAKANKEPVRQVTGELIPETEKPAESDRETEIWSDVPDEAPQPDWEKSLAETLPSVADSKPSNKGEASQPMAKADRNTRKKNVYVGPTLGSRSSMRLAVTESLRQHIVTSPTSQQQSGLAPNGAAKSKGPKKRQTRASKRPESKGVSPKASVPESGSSLSAANPVAGKLDRSESDDKSKDIPLKDLASLSHSAQANAIDVNISVRLELPPPVNTLSPPTALASPDVHPMPSSNLSGSVAWDDSCLPQYVRIPVWAKSRQELCELPYFKSMQGGVYTRGGTVYGYLLGRFPSPRDAWCHDGRLIISHGGGKNVMDEGEGDPTKARHQLGDDQLESDKSVRALLTSYRMFRPIVILAEADYESLRKFNLKQGYTEGANYYVLGHYAIVAAWAEQEEVMNHGSIHTRWKFAFQYIEDHQGPPWWLQPPGTNINVPEPPSVERISRASGRRRNFGGIVSGNRKRVSEVTTESFPGAPSIVCEECMTLSPHVYAVGSICLNPDCSSFWKHNGLPVSQSGLTFNPNFLVLRELPEQLQRIPYPIVPEYPDWRHRKKEFPAGVIILSFDYAAATDHEWTLQAEMAVLGVSYLRDNIGRIVHVLNNSKVTQQANWLFEQYQQDASSMNMFQRHAMKTHGVKGELYAQHYSHNAYAEGQEMNFHSDDEPGLGPVIAGLTLGSHAEMLFRYHVACKKNLTYKNGPFRPSEARTSDDQDSNERVLQIILSHGDLLIMDGTEIQKQYEHAVFVRDTDMVRFAATARLINPRPQLPAVVRDVYADARAHQEGA
ncbi:unnamed protein product [Rhizoctonia solani]|uniref:Alpha-ketoglutarate-dependent dioxygenase AlkB-like domain-containing protein n=1 Tax=Rhizoctonia solani TaxID=456999 RepID=A0A8H3CVY2_9AGAM|nr:unnamed protein product [Rhizoctonia solani]